MNFLTIGAQLTPDPVSSDAESPTIPTGGFTLGLTNSDWGGTQLLFSALYGEGSSDFTAVTRTGPAGDPRAIFGTGEIETETLDLEVLVVRPLGTTGAYWTGGVQYRAINQTSKLDDSAAPVFGALREIESDVDIYVAKAGIGAVVPLRGTDGHRLFGNLIGAGGVIEAEGTGSSKVNGWLAGIDLNVGWQYVISDRTSLALRYRAQIARVFSLEGTPDDFSYTHGPELNLTYRF